MSNAPARLLLTVIVVFSALAATPEDVFRTIRQNDLAALKHLAGAKDLVNRADSRGMTPLHYAAVFGSDESLRILLDAGADVSARNSNDGTPLLLASTSAGKVALLLKRGADPNAATRQGRTPLMVATASTGGSASAQLLIEAGARVDATNPGGTTPLHLASSSRLDDIAKLLLKKGAKPDAVDQGEGTPLLNAAAANDLVLVKLLLRKGADPNAMVTSIPKVKTGDLALSRMTPLILAAPYGSPEMIQTLIKAGAKVNAQDARGLSPLMAAIASENQDQRVIRALLDAGADFNAVDTAGDSVLDWARRFGHPETLRQLQARGAKGKPESQPAPRPVRASLDPAASVERAVGLLQRSSGEFFKQSGCVGCHHQSVIDRAADMAKRAGLVAAPGSAQEPNSSLLSSRPMEPRLLQMEGPGGGVSNAGSMAMAFHATGIAPNSLTDAIVHYVAGEQDPSGSWSSFGIARPPIEDSSIGRTVIGISVLRSYGWPARQPEWDERIGRARAWLLKTDPKNAYDQADRLLGLFWSGAKPSDLTRAAAKLRFSQHPNGGWSQNPHIQPDAYATGLALYALLEAGQASPTDPLYKKAVTYLLQTQREDGSWYVPSRSPKFQPYFQSGFPHDHDQWISSAGTAYAVMGLAPAIARPTTAQ